MEPRATHSTTLTFLFTDIVGSTRQWESSPDMHAMVERHFALLHRAVAEVGGEVFSNMGDGIAAAFPSAELAVRAAIAAQVQMPAIGLDVRMGIHTGEAERVGDDLRGRPVNRAARIMAVGHGGQILLSNVTAALIQSGPAPVELVDLGMHRLRDLSDAEHVWQVAHPNLETEFPALRGLDTFSNNLPSQRSSLVGRERDVERVVDLVQRHRIVTLTGVGGVGKTRLALQSAADLLPEFSDVWFVSLASVTDPHGVADAIALTIGIGSVMNPTAAAAALLARDRALLVVDNCEHVVDSASAVIDSLISDCPNLSVIATSREALGIDGEHIVAVRSLDPATTAVDLFEQRAESAGATSCSTERSVIEQICQRLDGIPLAIELAAARSASLGAAAVLDALDNRFSLLSGGRRRAMDRHSTMRSTIDWSYRLLPDEQQRLFQWLAVYSSGLELDAVAFVATGLDIDEFTVTEHLASLVTKSMVVTDHLGHGLRFRMLETLRAFALEQLDEHGERWAAQHAQAEWIASLTDLSVHEPCSADVQRNAIRLEREIDNWRDAVLLATRLRSSALAGRLCGPPTAFFVLGRHDLADDLLPLLDFTHDLSARRSVLVALMVAAAGATDTDQLIAWYDEVRQLDATEPTGVAALMGWLTLAWQGKFDDAVALCTQASLDERFAPTTRDMLLGIAILDHFGLTDSLDDPHGLVERATNCIAHSEVAIHRITCRLGVAWALREDDPEQSLVLVGEALDEIADAPPLTRLTLPGSASRLLMRLDPKVSAKGLLQQLDATPLRRSFVDLIPVFYAAELLQRVGHPAAATMLSTMAVPMLAPYVSMMDFVDLARRAATANDVVSLGQLETVVRVALRDIVDDSVELHHAR
jgi:predicted ATPase/class 3 adenylate cyclase